MFAGLIIILSAILITLIILIIRSLRDNKKINIYEEDLEDEDIKKVKNVKKEDIIESPSKVTPSKKEIKPKPVSKMKTEEELEAIDEEEIEDRYKEENQREIEEVLEENSNSEIENLIMEMENASKMRPEDVVAKFEKEQEAQSIISYRELVNVVRNRQDEYYEDELESKPLKTVSDYMKQKEDNYVEEISLKEKETETKNHELYEANNFRKTEIISPVFGRMDEASSSYSNVPKSPLKQRYEEQDVSRTTVKQHYEDLAVSKKKDDLDEIYQHMASDLKKSSGQDTLTLEKLTESEEFIRSIKNF